jgi:hypothetical protein
MHRLHHPCLYAVLAVMLLVCTGISSAAPSDHPVVTAITGPNNLNDGFQPTGSYVFMASVAGGSPPYTYKWTNPPGIKTLFEGKEYSSVTIPAEQLATSGTPRYGVWLTVTDSAGRSAVWQRDGGMGSSSQYFYGMDFTDYPEAKWTIITEPKTFPKAPASSVVVKTTTQNPDCKDSGARFTGMNGDIQVFSECSDSNWKTSMNEPHNWKFAQPGMVLYYDDHVKTGEDSVTTLGLADMSTFVMKPESEIVLASPPNESNLKTKIKLVAGNMWTNIKKMAEGGSVEVEMNQGVCGIKGTTFIVSSDGKQSTLQVIEGTVEMTGKADGKKVLISGGQQVTATGTGLGTAAPFDSSGAQADWSAVQAKALSGTPAPATTRKSGLESILSIAGIGIAAAALAMRRK